MHFTYPVEGTMGFAQTFFIFLRACPTVASGMRNTVLALPSFADPGLVEDKQGACVDFDACANRPCHPGASCTDLPAPSAGFEVECVRLVYMETDERVLGKWSERKAGRWLDLRSSFTCRGRRRRVLLGGATLKENSAMGPAWTRTCR